MNDKDLIKLFSEIGSLKKVVRTGWALKGIKNPESVADHTFRVAMFAMILAPKFRLNQSKLIKMALVHDLGEAVIGDIKWESGSEVVGDRSEKHKDEKKAIEEMLSAPELKEYIDLWNEFEEQKSEEAKFIKELDKLEMAFQALEYEQEGNPVEWFAEFWENIDKYLKGGRFEEFLGELKALKSSH